MSQSQFGSTRMSWLRVAVLSSLAAACASTTVWENTDVPREQCGLRPRQCQQQARMQAVVTHAGPTDGAHDELRPRRADGPGRSTAFRRSSARANCSRTA